MSMGPFDCADLHARAWQDALREFGHDIEFQVIRGQIGKGGDQLMPVFLGEQELAEVGKRLETCRGEIMKQRYLAQIRAFPGVRALFERIRADGMQVALASSAKQDELEFYNKTANIADLVAVETSSDDAERSQPHPDIFKAASLRLDGLEAANMLVVGDTPYDAEAAGKAGLRTIGVLCGGFAEADLRNAGCVAIDRGPADILARFDGSEFAASR